MLYTVYHLHYVNDGTVETWASPTPNPTIPENTFFFPSQHPSSSYRTVGSEKIKNNNVVKLLNGDLEQGVFILLFSLIFESITVLFSGLCLLRAGGGGTVCVLVRIQYCSVLVHFFCPT